ncbi:MAG: response regulator transcription factor [Thermomicrobiales bacterium]
MGLWYATMGRLDDAIETNRRSFAMLVADSPTSGSHAAILHWGAGLTYASLGDPDRAAQAFRRSRDVFKSIRQNFHAGNVTAYELKYITLRYFADDLDQRSEKASELLAFGQNDLASVTNDPPDVFLSPLYLITGQWDELRRMELEARHLTRSVMFFFAAHTVLAEYFRRIGCVAEAREAVRDCFPRGPEVNPEDSQYRFEEALELQRIAADLALDGGDPDEALPWIRRRHQWLDWSGRVLGLAEQSILESRYHSLIKQEDRARDHAVEAVQRAENPRQPLALLQGHLMLGEVLTRLGDLVASKKSLQQALDLALACDAPYERALVQLAFAELHQAAGDDAAIGRGLAEARRVFEKLGAAPALERLRSIQSQVVSAGRQAPGSTEGLSEREIEVLRHVAEGMTDREIGERLFISPRTVGQHLRSIFNKLDVNSRTAAAIKGTDLGILDRSGT